MPRRGQISKRDVLPDPMYNSQLVTKLINQIMYDGKKGVAQKIVYDAFATVEAKTGKKALEAGKHLIMEKPFTSNYQQAVRLKELANEKGLMIFDDEFAALCLVHELGLAGHADFVVLFCHNHDNVVELFVLSEHHAEAEKEKC